MPGTGTLRLSSGPSRHEPSSNRTSECLIAYQRRCTSGAVHPHEPQRHRETEPRRTFSGASKLLWLRGSGARRVVASGFSRKSPASDAGNRNRIRAPLREPTPRKAWRIPARRRACPGRSERRRSRSASDTSTSRRRSFTLTRSGRPIAPARAVRRSRTRGRGG